ncbi:LAMI_0E11804g1_1 [Lachancea mirantina]|uniref:LAMI_0E11804g1_1 n=1 Tax=Lachancea mirantina TaxID=1230905 RepID=A0A1G4JPR3_9SACH|nr:LAMI_0E11804g1_1 [Lachancea mirantina]
MLRQAKVNFSGTGSSSKGLQVSKKTKVMTSSPLFGMCFVAICFAQHVVSYMPASPVGCSAKANCPEEWPCCSQYGHCGRGPLCVGGCDPRFSYADSCIKIPALMPTAMRGAAMDVFESENHFEMPVIINTFQSDSEELHQGLENKAQMSSDLDDLRLVHFSKYLVTSNLTQAQEDVKNYDFTYSGPVSSEPGRGLVLGMPAGSSGSLVSSAKSFLYGKVSIRMSTARGAGVVSAIDLVSAVRDEIDFEFIGNDLKSAQSNFYFQGEPVHTRMLKAPVSRDTFRTVHTYEIDWDENRIHWLIDGVCVRTLRRRDTFDPESGIFKYPQTPMRLEVSLWPAGIAANHPGTISWAGGMIDWENSLDILERGQFYLIVKEIQITPYRSPQVLIGAQKKQTFASDTDLYFYDNDCDDFTESCVKSGAGEVPISPNQKFESTDQSIRSRQSVLRIDADAFSSIQHNAAPSISPNNIFFEVLACLLNHGW